MRGLLFVDLDNVPDMATVIQECHSFMNKKPALFSGTAVVCLAANTFRLYEDRLRCAALRDEARQLAEAFGATCERIEIAITLTMPQTADFALRRLAKEAPSPAGAGNYDYAAVLTKDRGLVQAFQRLYSGLRWVEIKLWRGKAWTSAGRGQLARRRAPTAGSVATAVTPNTSSQSTVLVADDGIAAWASSQPLDVAPELDLFQLALKVDREPWLLTQIGPSTTTVRGIARLESVPLQSSTTLGPVASADGLEVRGAASLPPSASTARAATTGIGAVRFLSASATVACRLPVAMLKDGVAYEINRNGVDIEFALQQLRATDRLGPVKVVLAQDKESVVASVEPGATSVDAWWVRHTETKSEKRVALPGAVSVPVKTNAFLMRAPVEFKSDRVCLGAGTTVGDRVVAETNIARGQIGQGRCHGAPVAIYALKTNIASGSEVPVRAIQDVALSSGLQELRLLPLVVPL